VTRASAASRHSINAISSKGLFKKPTAPAANTRARIRDLAISFMDKAQKDGKPFFVWLNPTRMHIVTHLSPRGSLGLCAIAGGVMGEGENLFAGIYAKKPGYRCTEQFATAKATHIVISRSE
jgi:hypothetical protein